MDAAAIDFERRNPAISQGDRAGRDPRSQRFVARTCVTAQSLPKFLKNYVNASEIVTSGTGDLLTAC
jgi:hypothetical protein